MNQITYPRIVGFSGLVVSELAKLVNELLPSRGVNQDGQRNVEYAKGYSITGIRIRA